MSLAYEPTENPCYNNSLFWHYAKFSKLMLTIYTSVTPWILLYLSM